MKCFPTLFILFFSLTVSSCIVSETSADSVGEKPSVKILEINSEFSGLYWVNGKVLNFRLFDDGTVEYDEYPLQKTTYNTLNVETIKSTKRVKISNGELNEIVLILESEDFSKVSNKISPQKSCLDAFINTKLDFNGGDFQKKVFIENHCTMLADPKSTSTLFEDFPFKLNELFQKIETIKNRESSGKFYN